MIFERIKAEGLAHNSYFIGSVDEAAVIDPRRDCQVYVESARGRGLRINHIFETHRNEDYVIGSIELAGVTGASIHHGPGLAWRYGNTLKDGQTFQIGQLGLTAISTPGHTDDSMSYALADLSSGAATVMVFTGDALFVGDIGRTDLCGPKEARRLASNLYDSIFKRLLPLGDGVILCPGHGGGSVCGMNISSRDESTLGIERMQNPLLQMGRAGFIKYKVGERPKRPPYFARMEKLNLQGPPVLGCLPSPAGLTPAEFRKEIEKGALLVDTREPASFGGAHIKGAYSIWLEGLTVFAGWVLAYDRPVLLMLEDEGYLEKAVRYLIRLGYDRIGGYLQGGIEGWYNSGLPVEGCNLTTVHELKQRLDRHDNLIVLDVRGDVEWERGHIKNALHVYVGELEGRLNEVPKNRPVTVTCNVGHRSGIAISILLREGYPNVQNLLGGMSAWRAAGFPVTSR